MPFNVAYDLIILLVAGSNDEHKRDEYAVLMVDNRKIRFLMRLKDYFSFYC